MHMNFINLPLTISLTVHGIGNFGDEFSSSNKGQTALWWVLMSLELHCAWISMSILNHDWTAIMLEVDLWTYLSSMLVEPSSQIYHWVQRDKFTVVLEALGNVNMGSRGQSAAEEWPASTICKDVYISNFAITIKSGNQSWFTKDIEIHAQNSSRHIKTQRRENTGQHLNKVAKMACYRQFQKWLIVSNTAVLSNLVVKQRNAEEASMNMPILIVSSKCRRLCRRTWYHLHPNKWTIAVPPEVPSGSQDLAIMIHSI